MRAHLEGARARATNRVRARARVRAGVWARVWARVRDRVRVGIGLEREVRAHRRDGGGVLRVAELLFDELDERGDEAGHDLLILLGRDRGRLRVR